MQLKYNKPFRTEAYINGEWRKADSEKTFEVTNPYDNSLLAKVADCGATETTTPKSGVWPKRSNTEW